MNWTHEDMEAVVQYLVTRHPPKYRPLLRKTAWKRIRKWLVTDKWFQGCVPVAVGSGAFDTVVVAELERHGSRPDCAINIMPVLKRHGITYNRALGWLPPEDCKVTHLNKDVPTPTHRWEKTKRLEEGVMAAAFPQRKKDMPTKPKPATTPKWLRDMGLTEEDL